MYWNILEYRESVETHTHAASGDAPMDGDSSPLSGPD